MKCDACGSSNVTQDNKDPGGWSVKYSCNSCGYNKDVTYVDRQSGANGYEIDNSPPWK